MRVELIEEEIKQGKGSSPCDCPIALAIKKLFPDSRPKVTQHVIMSTPNGGCRAYELPQEAIDFIRDFDRGRPVCPIAFDMKLLFEIDPQNRPTTTERKK